MSIASRLMARVLLRVRLSLGFSKIPEICENSTGSKDYHDYPVSKGGNGYPSHLLTYQCWKCGKRFEI